MKKSVFVGMCILLIAIVIVGTGLFFLHLYLNPQATATGSNVDFPIRQEAFYPANHAQNASKTFMTVFDGKLYFFCSGTVDHQYAGSICQFTDGAVKQLIKFDNVGYIGALDGFVYYYRSVKERVNEKTDYKNAVYCYSLDAKKESYIMTVDSFSRHSVLFLEDGTVLVPQNENKEGYYVVVGDEILETTESKFAYTMDERSYSTGGLNNEELYCIANEARCSMEDTIPYGSKTLIPHKDGLLVHNEGQGDLLYYIEKQTGNVREIFSVPCMASYSAVNVHEDIIFLSFVRYEKHGEFGMVRYENDSLSGTYKIDLSDGSATKISDSIYSGLYIFEEGTIFAVDEKDQIHKLDFDGNQIDTLLSVG